MHPVLEAKILLEREIARPLYKAGETYIQAWGRQNGNLSAFERMGHQDAIRNVLQRHYARVVMVMTGRAPSKSTTLAEAALSLQHIDWLHSRALDHAQLIMRSIDGELAYGMAETAMQHVIDDHTGSLFGIKTETKADGDKPKPVDRIKMAVTRAVNKLKSKLGLIATTETNGVAEDARRRAAEAEAQLKAGTLMKRWISLMDGRERPSHHDGHNDYSESPIPIAQPFVIGGSNLMFPGDQSMGAPLKEVINCFPGTTSVSGRVKRAMRHWYEGEIVEVRTAFGLNLSGTPNHPILTPQGWVGIGQLHEGSDLVRCAESGRNENLSPDGPNVDDSDPTIEQVFNALSGLGLAKRLTHLAVDFHGDKPTHDVDIVGSDSVLLYGRNAETIEHIGKILLALPFFDSRDLLVDGLGAQFGIGSRTGSADGISVRNQSGLFREASSGKAQEIGFRAAAHGQSAALERADDGAARDAELARYGQDRALSQVHMAHGSVDRVVSISRRWFAGHVYNLECEDGIYVANGVVAHNCRCSCVYTLLNPDGTHSPVAATPHAPTRRYARGPNPSHPVPNFRGPSPGPPLKPTSVVTLNGRTRARVVLRDARTIATMRQVTPSTIEVAVSGRVVGRATVQNGRATGIVIDKNYRSQGIEDLIRRSVTHSHQRRPEAVR